MNTLKYSKIIGIAILIIFLLPMPAFAHNPEKKVSSGENIFNQYNWIEIWNPLLILLLTVVFIAYMIVINKFSKTRPVKYIRLKKLYFFLGLVLIYISLAGPIAILSNNLVVSVHMLQQAFMYIGMPPLILLAMPHEFYKYFDEKIRNIKFVRFLLKPLVSALLFNALWSFYHIPVIYEYFLENVIQLELLHVVINTSAFLMWIQVLAPQGLVNSMSYLIKMGYMFLNGMLITPACALIIFADVVIYPSLFEAAEMFSWLEPNADQQLGGLIMKITQEISYGAILGYLFFKWAKTEREKDEKPDEIPSHMLNY